MHELAHIKRGDLWVNLAQSLLQIVYFYNPLLWLANVVIRRVREQAVDEMVLVAMGEKSKSYPQTLINVAKLAFKRPALSLRLIGVVESKSALSGRVKKMLNQPIPKSAKLGFVAPGDDMLREAVEIAAKSDAAVIFAGLSWKVEGEGVDKANIALPAGQNELIKAVSAVNKNTIVVLINGTPVNMEQWVEKVPAIVEAWYPGQEGGNAIANILFGKVNPSGKLSVTFPKKLSDNPSYGNYPGSGGRVHYREGIFVGYRHYDKNNIEPLFPFGHGLSYTTFKYSDLKIDKKNDLIKVSMDLENTGKRVGKEVVQLYIYDCESSLARPPKELKAFKKINLKPGEKKTVKFELDKTALSFYDPSKKGWVVEPGKFEVLIGSSSRDIRLKGGFVY